MKTWIILLTLVYLAMGVYAECEGSLTIVDVPRRDVGDTMNAISYTTIPATLGIRNWDLTVIDPQGNTIALTNTRVDNSTYTITAELDITDEFLKGEYVLKSRITVLNPLDLTQEVCSETATKAFTINTTRTSYSTGTIHLQMLPGYAGYSSSAIKNVSFAGAYIPMNVTIKNIPVETQFDFSMINITGGNASVNLTTPGFCWTYDEREKCQNDLLDKDRVIEKYASSVSARIENITTNCFGMLDQRDLEYNMTRQEIKTLSSNLMNKTEQANMYITQLQTCQYNNTQLDQQKDSIRINVNFLVAFVVGAIFMFIGLNIAVNRKMKEVKENE